MERVHSRWALDPGVRDANAVDRYAIRVGGQWVAAFTYPHPPPKCKRDVVWDESAGALIASDCKAVLGDGPWTWTVRESVAFVVAGLREHGAVDVDLCVLPPGAMPEIVPDDRPGPVSPPKEAKAAPEQLFLLGST